MPYIENLFIPKGTTWSQNVVMYTSNTSGRFPADMSLYANGAGQIRKAISSANAAANLTVSIHSANTSGIVTISLDSANTSAIDHGRYLYDVKVITTGGTVNQVVRGQVTFGPQMTRWDW